jgi:menaquinone-dependent protoporphyrinogen oxidase
MKTLILYASKYGAAEEIARRIAQKMDGSVVYDLKQGSIPPLEDFDCIILGSSVYAGNIRKEAKAFVAKNAAELGEKTVGLFISGLGTDINVFSKAYPPGFADKAKAKSLLGGIFDPQKCSGPERFIIKMVSKLTEYTDSIDDETIDRFIATIKEA